MDQTLLQPEPDVVDLELRLKPKCLTCGNSRTFYVSRGEQTVMWNTMEPMPSGARVRQCGRCRSRNSLILDYSD